MAILALRGGDVGMASQWILSPAEWSALPEHKGTTHSAELRQRYECAKLVQSIGQRLKLYAAS